MSNSTAFAERYQVALRRHLRQAGAGRPEAALRLGREAVRLGLETLDLSTIHERAWAALAQLTGGASVRARAMRQARAFFACAITPLEQSHPVAMEDLERVGRLDRAVCQRLAALAAAKRRLEQEVARRRVVEESLRLSERRSQALLAESRQLQLDLRKLSRRVLLVQEDERRRISRELHDVIAQMLSGINVRLASLKTDAEGDSKGLGRKISRAQRLVARSVDIVHRFALELRPSMLDDLGLVPALHSYLKRFAKETGLRVSLTGFAGEEQLSSAKRTALYRVAQEALTNVVRHARASRVDVRIRKLPNAMCMEITDDGQAFDVEKMLRAREGQHLGLLGMRERMEMAGGTFEIVSAPRRGTTIRAQLRFAAADRKDPSP